MYNSYSNPTVTNCTFSSNRAAKSGGGMCNDCGSPTVTNCTFSQNSATGCREEDGGGGMYNSWYSSPTLTNCTFSGNLAERNGGGMYIENICDPNLTNCTFSGNSAVRYGGGIFAARFSAPPNITNCILWGDIPTEIVIGGHIWPVITYSDVQGGWSGSGGNNIDTDP